MTEARFNAAYYHRFYDDADTRVATRADIGQQARAIACQVRHWTLPVRRILDAGCGLGLMRTALLREFPRASYTGLEVSAYLCQRYGWIEGSVAQHRTTRRYDLVICSDVLQYLSDRQAATALANLGRWCHGVLYFQAPTSGDWSQNVDRSRSDAEGQFRAADWYRARLRRNFRHMGLGLHVRRGLRVPQLELEAPWS